MDTGLYLDSSNSSSLLKIGQISVNFHSAGTQALSITVLINHAIGAAKTEAPSRRTRAGIWSTEYDFRSTTSSCNPYTNANDPYSNTHVLCNPSTNALVPYSNANIVCNPYTNASNPYTNQWPSIDSVHRLMHGPLLLSNLRASYIDISYSTWRP